MILLSTFAYLTFKQIVNPSENDYKLIQVPLFLLKLF